jgi:hypothetical protein
LGQLGKFKKFPARLVLEHDPHQKKVIDQNDPNWDQDGILGGLAEGLNFQVLLYQLEKEFDLLAAAVRLGYLQVFKIGLPKNMLKLYWALLS